MRGPVAGADAPLSPELRALRVGGVSYLVAMPALYGLAARVSPPRLRVEVPAVLAKELSAKRLDIALAPVVTLAGTHELEIAPRICIGCDGPVESVIVVSERPVTELETLLLDINSRTSVILAQLVTTHLRGGRRLSFEAADHDGMRARVGAKVGAVVIGDEALRMRHRYRHVLDLGQAWREWTGLPFVFAGWVARAGAVDAEVQRLLEDSLSRGGEARPRIAADWAALHGGRAEDHLRYLTESARYHMDERFEQGLREFFGRAHAAGLLPARQVRFAGRVA